jgi:general secretion pathway protein D
MLIITDTKSNISRLMKIIEALDVPGTGEMITVIPLKNASAQTIATNMGQSSGQLPAQQEGQCAGGCKLPDNRGA